MSREELEKYTEVKLRSLVIQAKKSGNYLMGTGGEPKDFAVSNTMASFNTCKYRSDCVLEIGLQGNEIKGGENW